MRAESRCWLPRPQGHTPSVALSLTVTRCIQRLFFFFGCPTALLCLLFIQQLYLLFFIKRIYCCYFNGSILLFFLLTALLLLLERLYYFFCFTNDCSCFFLFNGSFLPWFAGAGVLSAEGNVGGNHVRREKDQSASRPGADLFFVHLSYEVLRTFFFIFFFNDFTC